MEKQTLKELIDSVSNESTRQKCIKVYNNLSQFDKSKLYLQNLHSSPWFTVDTTCINLHYKQTYEEYIDFNNENGILKDIQNKKLI